MIGGLAARRTTAWWWHGNWVAQRRYRWKWNIGKHQWHTTITNSWSVEAEKQQRRLAMVRYPPWLCCWPWRRQWRSDDSGSEASHKLALVVCKDAMNLGARWSEQRLRWRRRHGNRGEGKGYDSSRLLALKPQWCRWALNTQEATSPRQAATGGRRRSWKAKEVHRRQAGGGALLLKSILKHLWKCHWLHFANYF
jgi:hypothetical protein